MSRRVYTAEDYRAALAELPARGGRTNTSALRARVAELEAEAPPTQPMTLGCWAPPGRETLAAAVIADAEVVPAPTSGVVQRRETLIGVAVPRPLDRGQWPATAALLAELDAEAPPSSRQCLIAAGLTPRPSGRVR